MLLLERVLVLGSSINERVWYSWTNPNAKTLRNSAHYVSDNRYYLGRGMYIYMYVGIGLEGHLQTPDIIHCIVHCIPIVKGYPLVRKVGFALEGEGLAI